MHETVRIGIVGYGNIGRAVDASIEENPDMTLAGIFSRRDPSAITPRSASTPIWHTDDAEKHVSDIDVAILCGGSATDLPEQGPLFVSLFNTVDSYDTHAKIPDYFEAVDKAARKAGTTAVISTGWDPGLFSLMRVLEEAILPSGEGYTFWGPGVSQGHSDAIRRIKGVTDARQYTIPVEAAVNRVRAGEQPAFAIREKHLRDCYVVAENDADRDRIASEIRNMPHYFSDYDTQVTFISAEEMAEKHGRMPHGGFVMRTGTTDNTDKHVVEFGLKLESNPGFTASVLVAYARAAYRLAKEGVTGAKTVFDIAPAYLSLRSAADLRRTQL